MYRYFFRPILFLFSPETIHDILKSILRISLSIPILSRIVSKIYLVNHEKLHTEFLGMKFTNPVGLSAGFDKNADFYNELSDFGFSHIEVGTVTPRSQPGNSKPRSFRLPADRALVNRMGFNNRGIHSMIQKLKGKRRKTLIIGGNIGKNTLTPNSEAVLDYEKCFSELYCYVDYFVVNVSCPNITDLHELQDQDGLEEILGRLAIARKKEKEYKPILLKISPDLNEGQIDTTIEIVQKYKIDGIVATNTSTQRIGLKTSKNRIIQIGNGGLSGAPLTNRSRDMVRYISTKTNGQMPIIGVGGIMTPDDAIEMLEAGASLIQIYTGFIYNGPGFVRRINKAILSRRINQNT